MRHKSHGLLEIDGVFYEKAEVGAKVRFVGEKQRYTIQASNRFYSVCIKPFNAKKTVIYTVIDWVHGIRGTENLVLGMGAETREECEAMLSRITNNETEISHRNWGTLRIESYEAPATNIKSSSHP